jgi:hypothetical protein
MSWPATLSFGRQRQRSYDAHGADIPRRSKQHACGRLFDRFVDAHEHRQRHFDAERGRFLKGDNPPTCRCNRQSRSSLSSNRIAQAALATAYGDQGLCRVVWLLLPFP